MQRSTVVLDSSSLLKAANLPRPLPPFPDHAALPVMRHARLTVDRLECIVDALLLMLRKQTKFPVQLPANWLLTACINWLKISPLKPVRLASAFLHMSNSAQQRGEDSTKAAEAAVLSGVHAGAARILCQLAISQVLLRPDSGI
jgi:hypothetical protein